MKKKINIIILLLLILQLFINTIVFADDEDEEEINEESLNEITLETIAKINEEPNINARAAIIYDRETKEIIWGKNENDKKSMASTTKIMTAIVVLENAKLTDIVTVSKRAAGIGGSRLKISEGDKISVNDLLYGLMLKSGNDTAIALAEHIGGSVDEFVNLMNIKAVEIGLKNTHFTSPHGLDDVNHYTTAYELAILTDYAMENETFCNIVNTKSATININGLPRNINNTNELLGYMQGVNGVKTGFTNNAGRCLVTSCTRNSSQIITVVLGCDTKKQRTADSIKLIEYAFKNYTKINLEEKIIKEFEDWKQININRIYINKAKTKTMQLSLGKIDKKVIPIKNDEEENIKIQVNAIYNYEAPVEENTKIGNLIVKKDDEIIETVDIICVKKINKKNVIDYFIEFIGILPNYSL